MLTPREFYFTHYDSGDPFGNLRPSGNRHLGSDFNGTLREGDEVPSWCVGTVTANGWSGYIGWYLIIRTVHGGWAGFYHLMHQSPLGVGAAVAFGQSLGQLGNTGSTSTGAHLHCMWSTRDGSPGTGNVDDPWPAIQTIVNQLSNTSTPLTETDDDMKLIYDLEFGMLTLIGGAKGAADLGKRADLPKDYETALRATYGAPIELTGTYYKYTRDAALKTAGAAGGTGAGFSLAQLVEAFDKADDASTAQIITALGKIKSGATPAEFVAELKAAL